MDHALIVEPLLARCKGVSENMLPAPARHSVATASLAIFAQMREVAREILQAKMAVEAQQRRRQDVARCCPDANVRDVHTRTVSPATWCGQITIPVRTCQGGGWGATCRPDDAPLGVPEAGDFTDDGRSLDAPVVAERPHRGANDLFERGPGVALSSRGAQGIIDRPAEDLRTWQATREPSAAASVADAFDSGHGLADLRVEIAMEGVMAHIDGRWQAAKVATMLVRRLEATPAEPTLGAIRARRDVGGLGAAEALAACLNHAIREAGWERIPVGEMLGDGAAWIGKVADRHVPGVRQPLDDDHRSEPLDAFATLQDPGNPAGAKAWVEQNRGALRMNRVGEVLSALKRRRPWQQAIHDALAQLIGDVARHRTRIRSQEPWHTGLAVGSGAVEGACTPVIQRRFKRAGMRWKPPGFLHVLAWRIARLHGDFRAFWASRGLMIHASR
ncbi:MAG: hypothetical protein EHM35_05090 [Planctomycetaceae bacterium]|nr:MAG: hypothetical protein EHM35_05090 [Planctomycetaceae bacterium]